MATKKTTQKLTQKQIKWLDKCTSWEGKWTLNPQTGLVDVKGDFNCSEQRLTSLQGVRFGVVTGIFYCCDNSLTSLEGAPQRVGEGFYCYNNSLTSLEGAPQRVGKDFYCHNNSLTSLEGAPQRVGGDFYCWDNPVPGEVLKECYKLMKKGKTYSEAAHEFYDDLKKDFQNKLASIYQPSFDWLSQEEHKLLSSMKKYQQIKELI